VLHCYNPAKCSSGMLKSEVSEQVQMFFVERHSGMWVIVCVIIHSPPCVNVHSNPSTHMPEPSVLTYLESAMDSSS